MERYRKIIEGFLGHKVDKATVEGFLEWFQSPVDSDEKEKVLSEQWGKDCFVSHDSVMKSYNEVLDKIESVSPKKDAGVHERKSRKQWRWLYVPAAAVISAVITATAIHFAGHGSVSEDVRMVECYVGNGEKQMITLPDSSKVILNSGTMLIYPEEFAGNERKVYLVGEGIFDVEADESHPFVVSTKDFSVTALGTLFNVSSYLDEETSSASLKEGCICVSHNSGDKYLLTPNQTFIHDKVSGKSGILYDDVDEAFAWKDGSICFQSSSIHEIFESVVKNKVEKCDGDLSHRMN